MSNISDCGTLQSCYQQRLAMQNNITNLSYYSPYIYPLSGTNLTMSVTTAIIVYKLLELANDKTLSVAMELDLTWYDPNLPVTWNNWPTNSQLHIGASLIWTMNVLLQNPATIHMYLSPSNRAYFYPTTNGMPGAWVQENIIDEFSVVCQTMNLIDFPFDSQKCTMGIMYGDYLTSQNINFSLPTAIVVSSDAGNTYWDLHNVTASYSSSMQRGNLFYGISVLFSVKRLAYYYTVFLIMPIILLQAIAILTAVLPSDRGEKVVLGATVVVAMYVLITTVNQQIPFIEKDQVPRLVTAFQVGLYMTGAILFEAVVIQTMRILADDFPSTLHQKIESIPRLKHIYEALIGCSCPKDKQVVYLSNTCNTMSTSSTQSASYSTDNAGDLVSIVYPEKVQFGNSHSNIGVKSSVNSIDVELKNNVIRIVLENPHKGEQDRAYAIDKAWRRIELVLNFITIIVYVSLMGYYFGYYIYIYT